MKLIDKWFKFPYRMYDQGAVKEASSIEEATGEIQEVDYVIGWQRIPYSVVYDLTWKDSYTRSIPLSEVRENGCDLTLVELPNGETCVCDWPRKTFEEKFDSYLERVEAYFDEQERIISAKTLTDEKKRETLPSQAEEKKDTQS